MKNFRFPDFGLLLTVGLAIAAFNSCGNEDVIDGDLPGIVISGVKWATGNVDNPGTFAANPEDAGMLYQWNRKLAWPPTGDITNWNRSVPTGAAWKKENDPCPAGYRVPTLNEIKTLLTTGKVSHEWTSVNDINGRKFTDKNSGNSIFLPAVGCRGSDEGTLFNNDLKGFYWCSTQDESGFACYLNFDEGKAGWDWNGDRSHGFSVRCVAKK